MGYTVHKIKSITPNVKCTKFTVSFIFDNPTSPIVRGDTDQKTYLFPCKKPFTENQQMS